MKIGAGLSKLLFSLSVLAFAVPSFAASTLHIGSGSGTTCATGGCPLYGGEVNGFGDTLSVYQNSGGAPALDSPFYLIFGAVNDTTGTALNSSMFNQATALDGDTTSLGALAYMGQMGAGDEAYDIAGFSNPVPNNSNSFTNWSSWEQSVLGITATSFGIYTLAINNSAFDGKDLVDISFNGLPVGTYAIGYGMGGNKVYGTPFTEAGLSGGHKVPEPSTMALLGLGLLTALFARRRARA